MNIDVHNHAFPESVIRLLEHDPQYGLSVKGRQVSTVNYPDFTLSDSLFDPAAKLVELTAHGLDAAVVSVQPRLLAYHVEVEPGELMARTVNQGLREFCEYDRDHLRWMASVPLQSPERSAYLLRQAARDGAVGVEIATSVAGRPLDEADLEPFWAAAEELRLPIFIHNAYNTRIPSLQRYFLMNVIGNLLETTICAERLVCSGVIGRFPGLRLVLAHAGGYFPFQAGRLRHATTVRKELSEAPRDPWAFVGRFIFDTITHDRQALAYLVSRVGVENVVMGSDLPFDMATPEPLAALREAVNAEAARTIAEVTPAQLYRFP
jgi:aminocarboxymuconate-semialdehyde decarboxylase